MIAIYWIFFNCDDANCSIHSFDIINMRDNSCIESFIEDLFRFSWHSSIRFSLHEMISFTFSMLSRVEKISSNWLTFSNMTSILYNFFSWIETIWLCIIKSINFRNYHIILIILKILEIKHFFEIKSFISITFITTWILNKSNSFYFQIELLSTIDLDDIFDFLSIFDSFNLIFLFYFLLLIIILMNILSIGIYL